MFAMTSQGHPYARLRRALATGNLTLIRAAAADVPRVELGDALTVCMAIRQHDHARFDRAALKWIARYCLERPTATLADVRAAAAAFEAMGHNPEGALAQLQRLCI